MAMSFASSSTSTSHGNTNSYDVFINLCQSDVKQVFANHIYERLSECGLRVFADSQEMKGGERLTPEIQEAIRTASVHLAIFSPAYAYSHRCLDELVLMVETEKTIFPIFYNVNPSELRWTQAEDRALCILQCIVQCTRGDDEGYGRALRMLEKQMTLDPQTNKEMPTHDSNTIEKWRKALSKVAEITGFELDACNRDEGLLVTNVIKQVLKVVPKTPLNVALYPIGLDGKAKEVERIVSSQQQSGNLARAVGIVGLGGIGKTTLAKQFFNSHISNYERFCFLSEVRENASRYSLNSLQAQLLKDLDHNEEINNTAEGISMIKRYLPSSLRALIVLDDVDNIDQLDALFSPVKHTSSLILVTSRNKDVLRRAGIVESSIYMLKGLNKQYSQELFCSHAFMQPYPAVGFEHLVEKFLDACDGFPLSLKVIGALLWGEKDLNYWKEQLHKISKISFTEIQSRLKISYDGLKEEDMQIFLDISCFFIGTDRDTAIRIWDGSGWQGWLGIHNLENRCLVEVDSKNSIKMHDQLRDLGRNLAKNSEYPLRLWRVTDNRDDLYNHSSVRGIHMVHGNDAEHSFEDLANICDMRRLQLLRSEGDFVERVLSIGHLQQLIYLHWDNCPYSSLPSSIPLKNLRVLYIKGEILETLWQHESQAPLELREIVIHANLQMIPKSFGNMKHLEKFVLSSNDLEILPDSVGNLRKLQSLDLSGCSGLQMLPYSVGNMTSLQSLQLGRCSGLSMLPDSVGGMTNLGILYLGGCSGLQMLPYSFGNMTSLQSLDLGGCSGLQMLPESVGNMTSLQSLHLGGCSSLQMLPDSVGNMTSLQSLHLGGCSGLQMLPDSVGNVTSLQTLDLGGCSSLQMLPESVGNMTNLQNLNLEWCSGLQILPDSVGNLRSLHRLELDWCSHLQMLPESVGNMTNLQILDIGHCSGLQMLPDSVGNMTNLQKLHLSCSDMQFLPDSVGNMRNLQSLDLGGCSSLQMLPDSVGNMTNLQNMDLRWCSSFQMLPDSVGNMTNLQKLVLRGCSSLQMLPNSVGNMTRLQSLDLRWCSSLQKLPDSITNLQKLDLHGCSFRMQPPRFDWEDEETRKT